MQKRAYTIGIDPGLTGAIACLDPDGKLYRVVDMPVEPKSTSGNRVDAFRLLTVFEDFERELWTDRSCGINIWIELVGAMPGQGVTSMFNFGEGCGVVRGVVSTMGFPMHYVAPAKWKRLAGLTGNGKEYALTVAKQLVPSAADQLTRMKDIGRADAILIAHHGRTAVPKA